MAVLAGLAATWLTLTAFAPAAFASSLPLDDARNYSVLFSNLSGKELQLKNTQIQGKVGIAGATATTGGKIKLEETLKLSGSIDFAGSRGTPGTSSDRVDNKTTQTFTINQNVGTVTSNLAALSSLSDSLKGLSGMAINLTSGKTINVADGLKHTVAGTTYRVFTVTGVSQAFDSVTTLVGNGEVAVFNFTSTSFNHDFDFKDGIRLTNGLTGDGVLWNVSTTKNVKIETRPATSPFSAFQGVLLAMNAKISVTNANVNGRIFGGARDDLAINGNSSIYFEAGLAGLPGQGGAAAGAVPEPGSLALALVALAGLGGAWRRRGGRADGRGRAEAEPPAGLTPA